MLNGSFAACMEPHENPNHKQPGLRLALKAFPHLLTLQVSQIAAKPEILVQSKPFPTSSYLFYRN
jgi:hypothetical protein